MKSTIVIYEHEHEAGKCIAKRIVYYLGAQTTCTHHIERPILETVDNFILCLSPRSGRKLSDEWNDAIDELTSHDLTGKTFAVYAENTDETKVLISPVINEVYRRLYHQNARVVACTDRQQSSMAIDAWICSISPNF